MSGQDMHGFSSSDDPSRAAVRVDASRRAADPITPYVTGKFCEHLGSNIYNGMEAQILRNPTFYDFPFGGAGTPPDGGVGFVMDSDRIAEGIRHRTARMGLGDDYVRRLLEARAAALAHPWVKEGDGEAVRVSPDAGPHFGGKAGRAQRVEVSAAGEGVAQLVHLPLHRTRRFEWRVVARSNDLAGLTIALAPHGAAGPAATAELEGLSREWNTFTGELVVPGDLPADGLYNLSLTGGAAGQFVVDRVLLYPADHVSGADPDVIRLLRDSRLPILRWPGGNFVSGYDWRNGIGPVDARPTYPNPAWSGVEPNLFGTDEFVEFCRAVGCEPMICINAGDGTPAEAAAWVEYCNGPADSEWGRRRADNGHPEPYGIAYWEIGNELTGRHQIGWTTSAGYSDRYREYAEAMLATDDSLKLVACGAPPWWGEPWNDLLFTKNADILRSVTDHILVGGRIDPASDPSDVYRDFMVFPQAYEGEYAKWREKMTAAGVAEPRMAVTELQLFGRVGPAGEGSGEARLTHDTLVLPHTMAEAVYDALVYHAVVRLSPFVEMVTHSATVNHGGGLRKERERVYANPCHWGQSMFRELAGATPVAVDVASPAEKLERVVPDLAREGADIDEILAVDAVAAVDEAGLLVSIVHRGTEGPLALAVELGGFESAGEASVTQLSAEHPWSKNTLDDPKSIVPVESSAAVKGGMLELEVPACSVTVVRVEAGGK